MNVDIFRPQVKDLIIQLYSRPVHPELIDTVAARTIQTEDYTVSVHITPTGHVVRWENADVCLTELAAARHQPLPEKRRLLHCKIHGELSRKVQCAHGVCYQVCCQVETLPPEVFLHVHDELLAEGLNRGLLHNFQPSHRLAVAPLSLIATDTQHHCLILSAFHTFPAEHTIVKSQTLIEVA